MLVEASTSIATPELAQDLNQGHQKARLLGFRLCVPYLLIVWQPLCC
jgi:hypothetical protein